MTASPNTWELFHDQEAPIYDALCYTQNTLQEVDFLIKELELAPGDAVLDVGCGTGRHAVELARRGCRVTGVDLSAGMLAQARAKARAAGADVEWIHADAAKVSLDQPFDAVICLCEGAFSLLAGGGDAIEHPLAILRTIGRVLKPGRKTLFTQLNGCRMIRQSTQEDVEQGRFDPLTLTTETVLAAQEGLPPLRLRERGFLPTEIILLFRLAGMSVLHIWGGTAGSWNKQPIGLDEIEIMILAQKTDD